MDVNDHDESQLAPMVGFALPANPQVLSRFVQLPPELKLIIFRLLLKSSGPLEPQGSLRPNDIGLYDQQTQLSSQLLRTCQTLFLEAGDMLYRQNTLVVDYDSAIGDRCHMLNISVPLPTDLWESFDVIPDLVPYAAYRGRHDLRPDAAHRLLTNFYPSLLRFRLVHVNFHSDYVESTFVACRLLRGLLSGEGREVTVPLANTLGVPRQSLHIGRHVQCLKGLRCSAINILGAQGQDVSDVVSIVQSGEAAPDLVPFYSDLLSVLSKHFRYCSPRGDLIEALVSALFENDLALFLQQKNAIFTDCLQQRRKLSKEEAADLKRQTRDRITELELRLAEAKEEAEDAITSIREAKKDAVKAAKRMLERTI